MALLLLPLEFSVDLVVMTTLSLFLRMSVIDLSCLSGISTVTVSARGSCGGHASRVHALMTLASPLGGLSGLGGGGHSVPGLQDVCDRLLLPLRHLHGVRECLGLGPGACLGPCGGDYSKQKRGVML